MATVIYEPCTVLPGLFLFLCGVIFLSMPSIAEFISLYTSPQQMDLVFLIHLPSHRLSTFQNHLVPKSGISLLKLKAFLVFVKALGQLQQKEEVCSEIHSSCRFAKHNEFEC